jgi:hypothetical protein
MTTQQNSLVGYGGYTPEELQTIVRRAHQGRAEAMREFFGWLFRRRKATAEATKQPAPIDAVARS